MAKPRIDRSLIIGIVLAGAAFSQTQESGSMPLEREMLTRVVAVSKSDGMTASEAFAHALSAAGVPGGIAAARSLDAQLKHRWESSARPLRQVLDSIVALDTDYRWSVKDGAVNLLPRKGEPPLLSVRIARFDVDSETDPRYAIQQLLNMPELRKRMRELNLVFPDFSRLQGPARLPKPVRESGRAASKVSLHRQNITLRDALNAIVHTHGSAVWAYSEAPRGGRREVRIDLLVQ